MFVNGVDQGLGIGKYIRGPSNNDPVKDVTSKSIICNANPSPLAQYIPVSAGDELTLEWFHANRGDDIIDHSHKGPVIAYIAPASTNGEGAVWSKIWQQAYTDDWATEKLIAASGHHTVTVPNLAAGDYLLRGEIIALHESDTDFTVNSARGAQFYMSCIQIRVVSSGSVTLGGGIDFQKDYKHDSPGILFNLYGANPATYEVPGGPVASFAVVNQRGIAPPPAAGSKPTTAAPSTSAVPTSTSISTSTRAAATTSATPSTTRTTAGQPSTTAAPTSVPGSIISTSSRPPLNTTSKMVTVTIKSTSTASPTTSACPTTGTGGGSTATVKKYYQCGGTGYTGSTTCETGSTCVAQNPYYSQCL
ncbi:hypothetical protein FRC07_001564 [Ceratobasidium sp. 392]|nr:hypothetical protein FRC07_001564 [Ceratobasidium sp. 392]